MRREGITAALAGLEATLNDRKLALLELERELSTAQGGLRDREETRTRAEHQVVLLRERTAGLLRRADEAAAEARALRERLGEAAAREAEAAGRLAALRTDRDAAQGAAAEREGALRAVETELRERRELASEHKQLSLDLFSTEADKRGTLENLRARRQSLTERRDAAAARRDELDQRVAELGRRAAERAGERARLEAGLDSARAALAAVDAELAALAAALEANAAEMSGLREQSAAAESRLETLLELKRNFDGVSEGVKALLAGEHRAPGTLGMISDVLEVPSRYLDALEASLGEAAAFVLVADRDALATALEQLRGLPSGRATLVDLAGLAAGSPHEVPRGEGVLGRASDLVRCEDRYRALVERLLGAVVVVEDRATAARLAAQSEAGLRFVSLDGEVWEHGRVRAGSVAQPGRAAAPRERDPRADRGSGRAPAGDRGARARARAAGGGPRRPRWCGARRRPAGSRRRGPRSRRWRASSRRASARAGGPRPRRSSGGARSRRRRPSWTRWRAR